MPTLICASNEDGLTIVPIEANATTHTLHVTNGTSGTNYGPANAVHDANFVPVLLAVSSADGVTPIEVYGDPFWAGVLISS